MERLPHISYDEFNFYGVKHFIDTIIRRKCIYYASDFLHSDEDSFNEIEPSVKQTMEVFRTLQIPLEEHFYLVFRGNPNYLYKDWKISELACVYMLMNGDPTDIKNLAQQQTSLINQMLQHMHPHQIARTRKSL